MTNDQKGKLMYESYLQSKGITQYQFTTDKFNRIDCIYRDKDGIHVVEIKYRPNYTIHSFSRTGVLLEYSKYHALNKYREKGATQGHYVMIFSDGYLLDYTLPDIRKQTWKEMLLPIDEIHKDQKKYKLVTFLPIKNPIYVSKPDQNTNS